MNPVTPCRTYVALFCFFLLAAIPSYPQVAEPQNSPPDWSKDYAPFQIVGNVYYVGTYDLACYLITDPEGNILINTGLAASTQMIKSNIEALGFKFTDTKILLTTQAHYDHVGAMAEIKKVTGAAVMVHEKDAGVLADGGKSDYAFGGDRSTFAPVIPDKLLKDGEYIILGKTKLRLLHHPGHTKGSSSFLFDIESGERTYKVLIVNMPSIVVSRKFQEVTEYPTIAADYASTFKQLKTLQFDLWLSSHGSQFDLHAKRKPGDPYDPSVFEDQQGYEAAVSKLEEVYRKKSADN
jgi:metallo-beta-lactamase class B